MDFGALVCKPVPICSDCPLQTHCEAYAAARQLSLPVKEKKLTIRKRWLNYVVLRYRDEIAIEQRNENDIWQLLYQVPLVETKTEPGSREVLATLGKRLGIKLPASSQPITKMKQKLTHQQIFFNFMVLNLDTRPFSDQFLWIKTHAVHEYAFPNSLKQYLSSSLR
jgi:A/G-specific adenine glycosylase